MWFLKLVDVDCAAHQDRKALQSCRVSLMVLAAHLAEHRECEQKGAPADETAAAWRRVLAALVEAHE